MPATFNSLCQVVFPVLGMAMKVDSTFDVPDCFYWPAHVIALPIIVRGKVAVHLSLWVHFVVCLFTRKPQYLPTQCYSVKTWDFSTYKVWYHSQPSFDAITKHSLYVLPDCLRVCAVRYLDVQPGKSCSVFPGCEALFYMCISFKGLVIVKNNLSKNRCTLSKVEARNIHTNEQIKNIKSLD